MVTNLQPLVIDIIFFCKNVRQYYLVNRTIYKKHYREIYWWNHNSKMWYRRRYGRRIDFIIINKHLIALTANNEYTISFPKESFIDSQVTSFPYSDKKAMIFSCHSYFSDYTMQHCILKMQKFRKCNFTKKDGPCWDCRTESQAPGSRERARA